MDATLYPDEELWLCRWLGASARLDVEALGLSPARIVVSNRIRTDANDRPVDPWTIGVHSDSGSDRSPVTKGISVRLDVTGPDTDVTGFLTARLAQRVAARIRAMPVVDPLCPFACIEAIYGPHDVPGSERPRFLITVELVLVGTTIPL